MMGSREPEDAPRDMRHGSSETGFEEAELVAH